MKKIILISIASLLLSCDQSGTKALLLNQGYTNIDTSGGYSWFACSKDDFFATEFTAKNPAGNIVSGTVCEGLLFKGSTIRFD